MVFFHLLLVPVSVVPVVVDLVADSNMPLPPMLDTKVADGSIRNDMAQPKTPFKLPQLDLGSIGIGRSSGVKKRAAAVAALDDDDDDEDPREEAQVNNRPTP